MNTFSDNPFLLLASLPACWLTHKLITASLNPLRRLPGPNATDWLWGHELIANESPYDEAYTKWTDSYGPTYKIKGALFHPDIIVTSDHSVLDCILRKDAYSYGICHFLSALFVLTRGGQIEKSPIIRSVIERLVGRGLVWAEGSVHKRQYQQLAPFFTTQAIRDTFGLIGTCAHKGAENLESHITRNADNSEQGVVDISEWTSSITLDIIGHYAFNYDFESGQSDAAQLLMRSWKEQAKAGLHWTALFGQVIVRAFPFVAHILFPFLGAQLAVKKKLREISQSIIDGDVSEGKERDILTTMVRLFRNGEIISTQDELFDHMSTMVIAGQETTAGSLGFALHLLATNPTYQTHLREEIFQLGREPTYNDLTSEMPWLDAIMKETFRHRPLVAHMERVPVEDRVLKFETPIRAQDGTSITEMPIKAGQVIHIPITSLNHAKSVWGEDADEFRPDRWLDPERLEHTNKSFGWNGMLVFSDGPHQCIGYRLAILAFKTILATYIRKFEFHDTGVTVNGRYVGTMQPYVAGREYKGTQLPLRVTLVEN
ncbi:unnamed protein product [Rhizoctonia solani]|uniref:Cytochrome P450 n=1 Tax=Rhizoctonia solani TaxID=456999 RepID=A0A8H2WA51_9AGAM|nr:unnamed protein product [Rhizoctonia solani]